MSPYIGLKLLFPELGTLLGYLALWLPDRSMAKFIQVLIIRRLWLHHSQGLAHQRECTLPCLSA